MRIVGILYGFKIFIRCSFYGTHGAKLGIKNNISKLFTLF